MYRFKFLKSPITGSPYQCICSSVGSQLLILIFIFQGCGQHAPVFLAEPPEMPQQYGVLYVSAKDAWIGWREQGGDPLWDRHIIPRNIIRVGVSNGIIYGLRENPKTANKSYFIIDTKKGTTESKLPGPKKKIVQRLKHMYNIKKYKTVPAEYYKGNPDGGER